MVPDLKIKISDLYKIFGSNGAAHIDKVRDGVGKTELLEKTRSCVRPAEYQY